MILFETVYGDYCFTYIDMGVNGRVSDSAIFRDNTLNIKLENNTPGCLKNVLLSGMMHFH